MWDRTVHDFGTVSKGQKLKTSFSYTGPLKIKRTTASCGCTVPTIRDLNNSQIVDVTFNTGNKQKVSNKAINIFFEDESYQMLKVTAIIK